MYNDNIRVVDGLEAAKYNAAFTQAYLLNAEHEVIVVEGNLRIDGHFSDWHEAQIKKLNLDPSIVIVKGDLLVDGDVIDAELLVMGNLACDYLYSDTATTSILGDAKIRLAYFGQYPHGECSILGTTTVPFLFNESHVSVIKPDKNTIVIGVCIFGFFDYDLGREDFPTVLVPSLLLHGNRIDTKAFISWIREGKSPFKNISDEMFSLEFDKKTLLKGILKTKEHNDN